MKNKLILKNHNANYKFLMNESNDSSKQVKHLHMNKYFLIIEKALLYLKYLQLKKS